MNIPDPAVKKQDEVILIRASEIQGNKRLPNESFDDYKKRRKLEQMSIKHHLQGRISVVGHKHA